METLLPFSFFYLNFGSSQMQNIGLFHWTLMILGDTSLIHTQRHSLIDFMLSSTFRNSFFHTTIISTQILNILLCNWLILSGKDKCMSQIINIWTLPSGWDEAWISHKIENNQSRYKIASMLISISTFYIDSN